MKAGHPVKGREFQIRSAQPRHVLDEWSCAPNGPIYEVIMPEAPVRLYLDVESVSPGPEHPPVATKAWLEGLVSVVVTGLLESGVKGADASRVLVTSDCRASEHGWKRSFHLTWPDVCFQDNHTAMKAWIAERVAPVIRSMPVYQWIVQYKAGPVVKSALDEAVYSRYRAWRVSYACKKGKSALQPWDVKDWCALDLDEDERREFVDCTLCSQIDLADRTLVEFAPPPASVAAFFDASIADEDVKEESAQPAIPAIPAIPAGSAKERLFVQLCLC
jgi:hypothetical protein